MIPIKKIVLSVLVMVTFVSCSEIYLPDIHSDVKALVVEGLITDGAGPFTVKLTEALPYVSDSVTEKKYVPDAVLTVKDNEGTIIRLTYKGAGNYATPSTFKAKIGHSYVLYIQTHDGAKYESKAQKLLPPQTYDAIHSSFTKQNYLDENKLLHSADFYDVRVDLFNSVSVENPTPLGRFESNVVIQYSFNYTPEKDPATDSVPQWYWATFGWVTYQLEDMENLTVERTKTGSPSIKDQLLCQVPLERESYGITNKALYIQNLYCRFKQYTINEDTYNFYKDANSQLAAKGKIFDPISSQLFGNMKCVSDSSKIVLGLFEVSSLTRAAFTLRGSPPDEPSLLVKPVLDISDHESFRYKIWTGPPYGPDEPDYKVIPYPSWWYHN